MTTFAERNRKKAEAAKKYNTEKHDHKSPCGCSGNEITRSQGELVITVQRTSFNINADLPYCIFGALYLNGNNFATVLQEYLPSGVTVVTSQENQNLTFTYASSGGGSDQIIVSVPDQGLINYLDILANLNTNYMRSNFLLFDCNAGDNPPLLADSQIRTLKKPGLFLKKIGGAGAKDTQIIIPGSRTQINNTLPNLVEIYLRNEPVKPDAVWVHKFAYTALSVPATRLLFNWTLFISERIDMNSEKIQFD